MACTAEINPYIYTGGTQPNLYMDGTYLSFDSIRVILDNVGSFFFEGNNVGR